jgi:HK97 family phage major capsid protein
MPYNSVIDRTDAAALIPEDVQREILQSVPEASFSLSTFRRAPMMSRKQQRQPVMSTFPTAYWVNGDTGLKQTTEQQWGNKYLNAEELAVIVPVPQAVIDDADYDIWGEVRPRIVESMGQAIDAAVLFGDSKPSAWPNDILAGATAASHTVTAATGVDYAADVSDAMALVEADGFDVNGFVAATTIKARLRGLREATTNALLFQPTLQAGTPSTLYGENIAFPRNGSWDVAQAEMLMGDWTQAIMAIREDITSTLLTEAAIFDDAGNLIYNLPQQDMVALRVVMRVAFQVANPLTRLNTTEATRYPFAAILPA